MFIDYFNIAFNGIKRRKIRSWLTMLGIFIGIATVISLIGLGEGLRIAITSQFGFLGTDVLSIRASGLSYGGPPGQGVIDPLKDDLSKKISKLNNVETAFNRYIHSGIMKFNNNQLPIELRLIIGGYISSHNIETRENKIRLLYSYIK